MRREEVAELLQRIPPVDLPKVVLVLRMGLSINIDLISRLEGTYLVCRGREAGTNDDGRGFFIPYEEISYLKLERTVKVSDLKRMYGEPVGPDEDGGGSAETVTPAATGTVAPQPAPTQGVPMDPASIAKQNLLERIRAARTSAGSPRR